jgi:hypothetical protein
MQCLNSNHSPRCGGRWQAKNGYYHNAHEHEHDIMKSFVHGVPTIVRKAVRAEVVKNIYTSAQIYHAFTVAAIPGGEKLLLEAGGIGLTRYVEYPPFKPLFLF